jgi:hypothetical protein
MILKIILLLHLFRKHNDIFEQVLEELTSFLRGGFLLLTQLDGDGSKDNDYMKTTEYTTAVESLLRFFRTLHRLSMEPINFELISAINFSMVLFVHNDLTRDEVPGLR